MNEAEPLNPGITVNACMSIFINTTMKGSSGVYKFLDMICLSC